MSFHAKCLLYDISSGQTEEVVIESIQDICDIIGNGDKSNVSQINIDKYHKVFQNSSRAEMEKGVRGYVSLSSTYDETLGTWVEFNNKDFFFGDRLLLVLCDDEKPIDMTDSDFSIIVSHISI